MRANPSQPGVFLLVSTDLVPTLRKKREGWGTRMVLDPGAFHRVFLQNSQS